MMCKDRRENIIALKNVLISKATCHIGRYIQLNDWTYQANGMMNRCCRCGYEWAPRSKEPLRCPSCKSTRWNKETIKDKCLRCGAEWVQRGSESPKYCPICHSSMWNSEKVTYTCPKCGLTRTLRSNSRIGLCPVCDRYVDSRPKTQFDDFRPKEAGVSDIIRIWTDGEGLTLVYVDNGRGMTYLYAEGDLVGSINFSSWCRNNKLSMEYVLRNYQEDSLSEKLSKLAMSMLSDDEAPSDRISIIAELRGITEEQAIIVSMHDDGMEPLPISLKLGIPFSTVMDTLNNIPPISGKGIRSDIGKDAKPDIGHRDILGDEKV